MAENYYDLDYTGSMVDRILDTGYDLQNQGYIFRGLASHYTGTPTERTWLIAPTGSTGFGLSSPVPPGSIGICMYNGSSWSAEVLNTLTLDTAPATGSGNGITSGAVKTLAESITNAIGQLEQSVSDRFTSLTLEDTTGSLQAELLSITLKYVFEGEEEALTSLSILAATAEKAGLMSAADKQKLDAFVTNIRSLRIQDTTAQDDQGSEITNTLRWTIGGVTEAISAFTLYAATTSKAGLMSAADKTALDTLPSLINAGYLYAGIATPSTVPSSTSAKIFYIAIEGGTYTNFDNLNVTQGINIIYKSGNAWSAAQVVGIDNEPTAGSENLVKSGGVKTELALGAVYDVSAHHNGATFESLSALLSDTDLNALIPTAVRKGGMSIKFVQSSDNKYVQFRYMSSSTAVADFTNTANWQGVDEEPTAGSDNLVKSGGVEKLLPTFTLIGNGSTIVDSSNFSVKAGNRYRLWINNTNLGINNTTGVGSLRLSVRPFDASGNRIGSTDIVNVLIPETYKPLANYYDFVTPDNTDYIVIKMRATVGDVLNCCIQDITILDDVEQQFSEVDGIIRKVSGGQEIIQFTPNYGIDLGGLSIGSLVSLTPISSNGRYAIVDVKEGDIAIISGKGGAATKTYGVVNVYNRLLLVVPDPSVVLDSVQVIMPATASKLIINSNGDCYLIRKNEALQPLQELENDLEDKLPTYDDPADYNFVYGQINSSNGELTLTPDDHSRTCNTDLIHLTKGDSISMISPIVKMALAVFDSDEVFVTYLNFAQNITNYTAEKDLCLRVMFGYTTNLDFSEPEELYSYLSIKRNNLTEYEQAAKQVIIDNTVKLDNIEFRRKAVSTSVNPISVYDSTNRLLSELIEVKAGTRITISDYTVAKIGILIFDNNRKYSNYVSFSYTASNNGYVFENDAFCEIAFGYVNDGEISDINAAKDFLIIEVPSSVSYADVRAIDYVKQLFAEDLITMHRRYLGKKQYRIHVDEVIYCLWRLATNNNGTANYQSVFDEPIFAEYKRIHDLYGTVFILSLHYTQDSTIAWNAPIPPEMIGWSLEDMPNTWKDEFKANSDWLKFSYHTRSYSYRYIGNGYYNGGLSLDEDITAMETQVFRFAGEDSWSCLYVKTHGILGDRELIRIFQKHGAKYFEGDAEHVEIGDPAMQTYYLTDAQQAEMFKLGSYYDPVVNALFMAGAGNIDRIGFLEAGNMKAYLEDFSTIGYGLKSFLTCNYMSFCAHESPMMDGLGIYLDNVQAGDYITLNGVRYTAGTDFAIGATDVETGTNLSNALPNTINKFISKGQYIVIYAILGDTSDSFKIHTCFGQIEKTAIWCSEHGFEAKHLEEGSFFDL